MQGEYNVPFGRYKNLNTKLITDKHYELLKGQRFIIMTIQRYSIWQETMILYS